MTLTAISQLWNAADFLARLPTHEASGDGSVATRQHGGVDSSKYADLLEVLFNALQVCNLSLNFQCLLHRSSQGHINSVCNAFQRCRAC